MPRRPALAIGRRVCAVIQPEVGGPGPNPVQKLSSAIKFEKLKGCIDYRDQTGPSFSQFLVAQLAKVETQVQIPGYQQKDFAQLRADAEQYRHWPPSERLSWLEQAQQVVERHLWQRMPSQRVLPRHPLIQQASQVPLPGDPPAFQPQTQGTEQHLEAKMLAQLQGSQRFRTIVVDIETTGRSMQAGRIIDLAGYDYISGQQFSSGPMYVHPFESELGAIQVHHIDNKELSDPKNPPLRVVAPVFANWVKGLLRPDEVPLFVAHNGKSFDHKWIVRDFGLENVAMPSDWRWFDTYLLIMRRASAAIPIGARKQGDLRERFAIPVPGQAHLALPDVQMLDFQDPDYAAAMASGGKIRQAKKRNSKGDMPSAEASDSARSDAGHAAGTLPHLLLAKWKAALAAAQDQLPELGMSLRKIPGLTDGMVGKLSATDCGTLWQLIQRYPRDYNAYSSTMQEELVQVRGTIAEARVSNRHKYSNFELWVDIHPEHLQGCAVGTPTQVHQKQYYQGYRGSYKVKLVAEELLEGTVVDVRGKVRFTPGTGQWELESYQSSITPAGEGLPPSSSLVPVYAASKPAIAEDFEGAQPKALQALQGSDVLREWEPLPEGILKAHGLMGWAKALAAMHQPQTLEAVDEARRRLAFDELFTMQLQLLLNRDFTRMPRQEVQASVLSNTALVHAARQVLPFQLTQGQERALDEIAEDLLLPMPMQRLLQGDVGCGKTIVAFMALLMAVGSGAQGAVLAPTEVLAEQHMRKLTELVDSLPQEAFQDTGLRRPKVEILTSSTKAKPRREILQGLQDGSINLVVGTHSIIADSVQYANLGLGIIDEQHRFGVEQRSALALKNSPPPHVLAMTATPIPRTLALVAHGDMAHSTIDEMPAGRLPIETHVLRDQKATRKKVYNAIKRDIQTGGRAFIVCPLIDESGKETMKSVQAATTEVELLRKEQPFGPDVELGLVHGRMSGPEKDAALQAFNEGSTPVLVSTSVVEVGVDIPQASVMVVNGAERFGLAQLHQLRGRVGRSTRASQCYLFCSSPPARQRLGILELSTNGFEIAQADLFYRGAGEVFGRKQSGQEHWAFLHAASLPEDADLLELARSAAADLIATHGVDPASWPQPLLTAIAYSKLPSLDFYEAADADLLAKIAALGCTDPSQAG
ncbi:hypothetical protein WJX73_006834 [Symbiochloris irregularis]|uniref:ATP-dependent DNA helicase RecG n=1 Tax=Symbiochloris irregularis TaxID=706552 RepID=A0AAW1PAN5_9CHLO